VGSLIDWDDGPSQEGSKGNAVFTPQLPPQLCAVSIGENATGQQPGKVA